MPSRKGAGARGRHADGFWLEVFIGNGIKVLLQEVELDGNYIRFALCALIPFFFCVSLVSVQSL